MLAKPNKKWIYGILGELLEIFIEYILKKFGEYSKILRELKFKVFQLLSGKNMSKCFVINLKKFFASS